MLVNGCHGCGTEFVGLLDLNDEERVPEEGNIAVCAHCSAVSVFTGHGIEVRPPTAQEQATVDADLNVVATQALTAAARAELGPPR